MNYDNDMSKNKNCRHYMGFTLIELVVAIGILSILSIFVLTVINPFEQFRKANDARRKADLAQIQRALEQYYQDNGNYPMSSNTYQIEDLSMTPISWGGSWQPYMNEIPKDPSLSQKYVYYSFDQQEYWIYASLERGGRDPQACNNGQFCNQFRNPFSFRNQNFPLPNTCGGICNYGVSSPNVSP